MARQKKPPKKIKTKASKQEKAVMSKYGLTIKQVRFAVNYVESLNATWSVREAGYKGSESTLGRTGWENTRKPKIKKFLSDLMDDEAMTAAEVLNRLAQQARANPIDFIKRVGEWTNKKTGEVKTYIVWDWVAMRKAGHLIKSIKETKDGIHIQMVDNQKATELLGRFRVLFTDKLQIDTAELEIIALIRDGQIEYGWMVEKSGVSLAERLFRQANVPIGKE